MMRWCALVLAAGRSSRMGQPKAWLRLAGEPLLVRIVRTALASGAEQVVVVVGSNSDPRLVRRTDADARLRRSFPAASQQISIVVGHPDGHPIDSLRAGLRAVPTDRAVLLWPVDQPFADEALVRTMVAASGTLRHRIVVPVHGAAWGHPVLLGAEVVSELHSASADQGAHHVVLRDRSRVIEIETPFRVVAELNTPAQAAQLGIEVSAAGLDLATDGTP
jgi:molybdenum cofactor cytidylyltransferase